MKGASGFVRKNAVFNGNGTILSSASCMADFQDFCSTAHRREQYQYFAAFMLQLWRGMLSAYGFCEYVIEEWSNYNFIQYIPVPFSWPM